MAKLNPLIRYIAKRKEAEKVAKEKPQSAKPKLGLARLMELAAPQKLLAICSGILAVALIAAFAPFLAVYYVVCEVISVYPDLARLDVSGAIRLGWIALGGIMGSHLAAFGILYELKLNFASRLSKLPLGLDLNQGSGKLREIIDDNIEKIENAPIVLSQQAVSRLIAGKTVMMIARRLRTAAGADKIIVLRQGRAAEESTHSELIELMAKKGLCERLCPLQQQSLGWGV